MQNPPDYIEFLCQDCDDLTDHAILKGRIGKGNITGTFKCTECGKVSSKTIRIPEEIRTRVMLSDGDETIVTECTLESDDLVSLDDEFPLDDGTVVKVTQIDVEDGRTVKSAQATKIHKLWVKQFGRIVMKISVNDGSRTYPLKLIKDPDDVIEIGSILKLDDFSAKIHTIKTTDNLRKRGSVEVRDIVRVYAARIEDPYPMDFDD